MTIENVASIINQVASTTKKNEKVEILAQHKDNTLLRKVLNHIFNPYIKTNIAKKKLSKNVSGEPSLYIKSFEDYMNYLGASTGKDENILVVKKFINSNAKELHWLLEAMATKTLKIGATASTINKAFNENFIPTFDVMLADKYIDEKKVKGVKKVVENWLKFVGKRVIATKKLDGNRVAIFVCDDGSVELYSREGHKLEGYHELEDAFSAFPRGFVYDGEVLATNEEGLNSKELFKKTSRIVKKKGAKSGLEFHSFDIIPIHEFETGGWDVTTERRKHYLSNVINDKYHPLVFYVEPLYVGDFDKKIIEDLADEAKANEEEGIMVQTADTGYECKRTKNVLKVKSFESADLRCLDVYEGKSGKNIGKLGGLILDYKGHRVNVGGGFSDEQRMDFWKDNSLVVGKIIEITYFEELVDDEGDLDLRFAQFKAVREDKTEPSYY